jgi:hypothetical protein
MLPAEEDLLRAWEEATPQHPLDRALTLLAAVWPKRSRWDLARLSIGTRDTLLLLMRERLFGPDLRAVAECPACGEQLEVPATTSELRAGFPIEEPPDGPAPELALDADGYRIRFRLLDSGDLAAVLGSQDAVAGRRTLIDRIVLDATREGVEVAPGKLPPDVVAGLEERLIEADPQAEILLALTCPACAAAWRTTLDVTSFLWVDVDRWARRLLGTVDTLARVYGWREPDVLALSPRRRRIYLSLATS